jgi:hypothetical protein
MIYQLLKRDDLWRFAPHYVLGSAVVYPLLAASVDKVAFLSAMLGLGAAVAGFQRATRFQAGLPTAARQLFLARLLSLLGMLWLPALAGVCMILATAGAAHAASALAVVKVAAVCTLAIAALQSIWVRELSLPRWLMFPVVFLFQAVGLLVARFAGATPVMGVCLPLSTALLVRTWRVYPKSYELAPAGRHSRTAPVPNAEKRAKTTVGVRPAAAWWPVLHSVFPGRSFLFVPMFVMGALSGQWVLGGCAVAWMWFAARQQGRWLWALPVNARALLLTILAPILLVLSAGYFTGLYLPKKHPVPAPDFNVQILTVAVIIGWALIVVLCMALYDWRRLGRCPKWVRALPALLLVGVPSFVPGSLLFFVPSAMDQFARVQRDIPQALSHAIPGGALGAVAVSVAALAALCWAVEKVFSEPEFSNKPRPLQDF